MSKEKSNTGISETTEQMREDLRQTRKTNKLLGIAMTLLGVVIAASLCIKIPSFLQGETPYLLFPSGVFLSSMLILFGIDYFRRYRNY